jgi:hypothetical protein
LTITAACSISKVFALKAVVVRFIPSRYSHIGHPS